MQVQLGQPVDEYYVVTSHSGTMLGRLMSKNILARSLLVTTPDRIDTITTAIAVHSSGVCPLAGVVITDHSGIAGYLIASQHTAAWRLAVQSNVSAM
jgi:hypothetical protein